MKLSVLAILAVCLAGCASPPKVNISPCGVIADSLKDVQGRTPRDTQRIDIHFERGKKARCWT